MPGTTGGNGLEIESVAPDVAESDPQARLQQLEEENRQLKSNIGRQNDLHGKRLRAVTDELEDLRVRLAEQEAHRLRDEEQARLRMMNPAQQAQYKAEQALAQANYIKAQIEAEKQQQDEALMLAQVIEKATKKGMPREEIDDRSSTAALISFKAWDDEQVQHRLERLEREKATEAAEAVRILSGERRITAGSSPVVASEKLPVEVRTLVAELEEAQRKRQGARVLLLKAELQKLGYEARLSPR